MIAILLVVFLLLLGLATSFSALETALLVLREQQGAWRQRSESAAGILHTKLHPLEFLHEALLAGSALNIVLASLGFYFVTGPLRTLGWNPWMSAALIFTPGFIFIELLPKTFALRYPERAVRWTLPALTFLRFIISPVTAAFTAAGNKLLIWFTPKKIKPRLGMDFEELETLIEMREEQGAITADDAAILQEIIHLRALSVKDCMTPRVDLPLMPHDASDDEAARMLEGARTRFVPVFDEKADAIIALVDTEAWRLARRPAWQKISRDPVLAPETMQVLEALRQHLPDNGSAVVIVDEYGGFEGLLTRNNIIERLIAKLAPAQNFEPSIQSLGHGRYLVSGNTRVDEVNRELDLELDPEGIDTIGGLVFNRFGYLPKPGERLELDGVSIKVKRTARNRIQHMELGIKKESAEDTQS
ncbi:MAG: CNNM domain-containing protein [Verrucomicrobiaceae bacterium]